MELETTLDWLTLALLPGLGPRAIRGLLDGAAARDVLERPTAHVALLGPRAVLALRSGAAQRAAAAQQRAARSLGVEIVGLDSDHYPLWLRRTYAPPLALWTRGVLVADEGERAVSVVGARAASPQGLAFARELGAGLAAAGVVVVSGLARGVDSAAHRGALDAGGRSVAVLGSGLDRLYPPENASLADRLAASGGALVSEFPLGTPPWKANFPRRNRVVAGWSRGVVVVEAGARSGALSTARAALEEGREVMAVPGHPSEPQAEGTNRLLRDGATLVRGPRDVLEELGLAWAPAAEAEPVADAVLGVLRVGAPASVEAIGERSGLPLPSLLARLVELELSGSVERLPGGLFVRTRARDGYTRP